MSYCTEAFNIGYQHGLRGKPHNFVPGKNTLGTKHDYETGYQCGVAVKIEHAERRACKFDSVFYQGQR